MSYYVHIDPPSIEMVHPVSGEPLLETTVHGVREMGTWVFGKHFVVGVLLQDTAFGKDYKAIKAAARIQKSALKLRPNDLYWEIQDDWRDRLCAVLDNPAQPNFGQSSIIVRLCFDWIYAIKEAKTERPIEVVAEPVSETA